MFLLSSKVERVEATAAAIRADVGRILNKNVDHLVLALPCDIRSEESVASLVQTTLDKFKRIDFLVNNGAFTSHVCVPSLRLKLVHATTAGGQFRAPAAKINLKGWDAVVRNNLCVWFLWLDVDTVADKTSSV
jgi:NAD(P)-dependent dehydrogenase (short-subunit alcohol dehydrogenase family)